MSYSRLLSPWAFAFPVVYRELRAASHRPLTYWMRVLAGFGATLFLLSAVVSSSVAGMPISFQGQVLFLSLHLLTLALILVFVPPMMADCIAREKREGTLGLLFMTPLTPGGIVAGKSLALALRAACLWLSILPVFCVPVLMGGVTSTQLILSLQYQFCVVIISIASGLLASCFVQSRGVSILIAELLAVPATALLPSFVAGALVPVRSTSFIDNLVNGVVAVSGFDNSGAIRKLPIADPLATMTSPTFAFALAALWISAWRIRCSWQVKPPGAKAQWWTSHFCRELFQNWTRNRNRRKLDSNPISWLQQYSLKSRLAAWLLCLGMLLLQTLALLSIVRAVIPGMSMSLSEDMLRIQFILLMIAAVIYTGVGVSSFTAEKRSGALELILISPVSVNRIIMGRAFGLWKQFLPAALSLLLFQAALFWIEGFHLSWSYRADFWPSTDLNLIVAYLSLPFYMTYTALRVKWTFGAIILSWLAPGLCWILSEHSIGLFFDYFTVPDHPFYFALFFAFWNLAFVALTFFLLRHSLSRRIYSF